MDQCNSAGTSPRNKSLAVVARSEEHGMALRHTPRSPGLAPSPGQAPRMLKRTRSIVKLAIRKKSSTKTRASTSTGAKANKYHSKPLEAGSRIRLTLVPSLAVLYLALVPNSIRKEVTVFQHGPAGAEATARELSRSDMLRSFASALVSRPVKLIDDTLMNMASLSTKVLESFHKRDDAPTFNSMDAAVSSLFGLKEYSLVRVTRAASSEPNGSVLLKLETASPGDAWLADDDDSNEELINGIGDKGDRPNTVFIKKVIARPRYKSDMKIYLIPRATSASLYVEERMLRRDLVRGVVDATCSNRIILCSFNFHKAVAEYTAARHDPQALLDFGGDYSDDSADERTEAGALSHHEGRRAYAVGYAFARTQPVYPYPQYYPAPYPYYPAHAYAPPDQHPRGDSFPQGPPDVSSSPSFSQPRLPRFPPTPHFPQDANPRADERHALPPFQGMPPPSGYPPYFHPHAQPPGDGRVPHPDGQPGWYRVHPQNGPSFKNEVDKRYTD